MWTFTTTFWQRLWGTLAAPPTTALLAGNMLLYTNSPPVGPDTKLADLVEPTYASYARLPIVVKGPYLGGAGTYFVHIDDVEWKQILGDTDEDIVGAAVVGTAGALIMVGNLERPVHLAGAGAGLVICADLIMPPVGTGEWAQHP